MRFQLPRDHEMLPEVVALAIACAKHSKTHARWMASYLFLRLWTELAYQSESHLLPGRFERRNLESFMLQTSDCGIGGEKLMEIFEEARMLEAFDYGWFCQRFAAHNFTMAHPWLDNGERQAARYDFGKLAQRCRTRLPSAIEIIPAENWPSDLPFELRDTVIVFIRTLDGICNAAARHGDEFGAGLLNSAWCAIRNTPPEKLDAALRRIHFVQRTKPDPRVPRETELLLKDFARVLWITMPDAWWEEGGDYAKAA